ncbi:MAG: PCP reductase family protein [Gemmatimonadales bacterium]
MKFLCIECDKQMDFEERAVPGDGTFAAAFSCPSCGRRVAMLANPMETQLVDALGVKIGGATLGYQPLGQVRTNLKGRDDAFVEDAGDSRTTTGVVKWTPAAEERLDRVPKFVRGMVKRIYGEYARDHGIMEITPSVMDQARVDLGLEGM